MTGVLDLMHALSYAYRATAVLDDPNTYRRQARVTRKKNYRREVVRIALGSEVGLRLWSACPSPLY